jgi:hypothetical protein
MDPGANPEHDERKDEAHRQGFKFEYVPCPECLAARRFVEIKSCDESNCFCGQWKYKELVKELETERKLRRRTRMLRKRRRGYI